MFSVVSSIGHGHGRREPSRALRTYRTRRDASASAPPAGRIRRGGPASIRAGTKPEEFLRFYAERFDTVELNTTGYRLPAEEQFRRWADAVPDGFAFAPKLALTRLDRLDGLRSSGVAALGDRLGPIRIVVQSARDDGLLSYVLGSVDPAVELAFDFRHESWAGVEGVVTVERLRGRAVPLHPPARAAVLRRRPARARAGAARRRPTSTSATRTSRPRRPTPRGCASSSPRGLRDRRRRRAAAAASSRRARPRRAAPRRRRRSRPRRSGRRARRSRRRRPRGAAARRSGGTPPHASTSATSASFTSSTCP